MLKSIVPLMSESIFHFKRFSVRSARSGLKVGTDGVILGACVRLDDGVRRVLDIGTGTGLIALMIAQRLDRGDSGDSAPDFARHFAQSCIDGRDDAHPCVDGDEAAQDNAHPRVDGDEAALDNAHPCVDGDEAARDNAHPCEILGIDIDADAAAEASDNFSASPWASVLRAVNVPLQELRLPDDVLYDVIVSNPPFFENSLKCPDAQRSAARHTDSLSYREIVSFSAVRLAPEGVLAMILPASQEIPLIRYAASFGLYPSRVIRVKTTAAKAPKRVVVELGRERRIVACEELVLMAEGSYTEQFRALTCNFYLR